MAKATPSKMRTAAPPPASGHAPEKAPRRRDVPLITLLASALTLLVGWSFAVPIFEAPDEPLHWQYARHLHEFRRLPVYTPGFGEANSPPLYYLLIAPFARHSEQPELYVPRPGEGPGPFITSDGIVHPTPTRVFQNRDDDFGRYWPIRSARLFTVLIALLTVFLCYLAGREATGSPATGLLAAGLVALLPQFTFRGSNVSNDPLVTALCALSLVLMLQLLRRGFDWPRGVGAAAAVAAAFLSKISAIFLVAPLGIALLAQKAPWRARARRLAVVGGIALLIVLPWTLRNQMLYGDPFASRVMRDAVPSLVDVKPITSPYFWTVFPAQTYRSFVGIFGWMNLPLPEGVYAAYTLLGAVILVGLAVRMLRRGRAEGTLLLLLLLFPLLNLLVVIYINLTFTQSQGRYLFPALPAIAVLAAMGLESLPFWSPRLSGVLLALLALVNVYALTGIVIPAYWPAPAP